MSLTHNWLAEVKVSPLIRFFPLVVAMVGVRRMPGLAGRKHQAVLPEQCAKLSRPGMNPAQKHGEHNPQFVTAYARIFDTDITDSIQHETFLCI